jgi:hypothetical protein
VENIWTKASNLISTFGFIPTELLDDVILENSKSRTIENGLSLFEVIRLASDVEWVDREYADVSFWNFQKLRSTWSLVWATLDNEVQALTGNVHYAIPWAYFKERGKNEILLLLANASIRQPNLNIPQPRRRPESRLIVGNGKIDAAIANTLSVLRVGLDIPYGDFIPKLIKEVPNDEDFLKALGDEVARQGIDEQVNDSNSFVPRELVRAKWKIQKDKGDQSTSFAGFLSYLETSNNLEGNSDQAFLTRLLRIAPETSIAVKQAISRDLNSNGN